ncbi:MAG: DUF1932 domain-containing protein [Pseudomonadota bacterium]
METTIEQLAFVGFGEAATAFVSGWTQARPARLTACDIRTDAEMRARYAKYGVSGTPVGAEALAGAQAVFSVVTADQALIAAENAAPHLPADTLWLDCNSCAPKTKRRAAAAIEAAGGRYVDVAVMAPVYPKRHHVPLLISGPHADVAATALLSLDMKPKVAGTEIGQASSIKMIRSIMVKGLEALSAECFLAARSAGVEDSVLASLAETDPAMAWPQRGAYSLERMMVHGLRRAAEMREVASTVEDLGLGGGMSAASADWQERIGALGIEPGADDLFLRADTLLARL